MTLLPIVERELRVAARQRLTFRLRFWVAFGAMVLWALNVMSTRRDPPSQAAQEAFEILSYLALALALAAGVFLTADSLSEEKREGTLGLLFLTDLRGYDVVLGKLAVTSLQAVYGWLAVLPILALPLLMGGITIGEFWRMMLGLLVALFFSLAAGMAVSAVCREARLAMAGTAGVILLALGILPALGELIELGGGKPNLKVFYWPSAGYLAGHAGHAAYLRAPKEYWGAAGLQLALAVAALAFAAVVLPRAWQEGAVAAGRWRLRWRRWRFGSPAVRRRRRARQLERNPYGWLAGRDRLVVWLMLLVAGVALPCWCGFAGAAWRGKFPATMNAFEGVTLTTFAVQLLWKFAVAEEATRRLSEDRASGALELLLVTPLTPTAMLAGQRVVLRAQLGLGRWVIGAMLVAAAGIWLPIAARNQIGDGHQYITMLVGNILFLTADYAALVWTGLWVALHRRHHRALLLTLVLVMAPSWGLYLLLGFLGLYDGHTMLWNSAQRGVFIWILGTLVWDWALARWCRRRLNARFREAAAGLGSARTPQGKAGT